MNRVGEAQINNVLVNRKKVRGASPYIPVSAIKVRVVGDVGKGCELSGKWK